MEQACLAGLFYLKSEKQLDQLKSALSSIKSMYYDYYLIINIGYKVAFPMTKVGITEAFR